MSVSVNYFDEKNSYQITFTLTDSSDSNSKIPLASIGTLYCTQFYYNSDLGDNDANHLATLNSRYNQNIKNANNVTVSSSGTITWIVQEEDTTKSNTDLEQELHIALIVWQYSGKQNSHAFFNYIRHVPFIAEIPNV